MQKIICIFNYQRKQQHIEINSYLFIIRPIPIVKLSLTFSFPQSQREIRYQSTSTHQYIYICMYISTPSYKSLNICGNNNITTPHTHNLSICCFLMKLFPSIMKHFNTNRPFTYTRCSMCSTLSFSENIAIMPILHPYYSCTS